ncbi:MAG TPA: hypothetical protein VL443_29935 [Cyclobacteriaceae bacterium]|jgi:hypothetical protein|nr:hypothetical protein [Cyclobacteriaceae bacterium]
MNKLEAIISKLDSVNMDAELLKVVDQTNAQAIDLNTEQLFHGRDAQGNKLKAYRNPAYAEFKQSLNPLGVTDLKLTGDFYRGFYAKTDRFPIMFDSSDSKTEMLTEKYGEIFGLDQEYLGKYQEEIKPIVQETFASFLEI